MALYALAPRRSSAPALAVALVLGAFLAPPLAGQSYGRTVPASMQPRDGSSREPFLLGGYDGRTQVLIAPSALRGFAKKSIQRIIVRRDAQTAARYPNGMKGGWIDLTILASWTTRDARNPSARFAANHAPGARVVYRGAYHVPDSPKLPPGTKVASLAPNVSAHIVLQKAIPYVANRTLTLEFVHRKHAWKPAPKHWLADLDIRPGSSTTTFGRSCFRPGRFDVEANEFDGETVIGGSLFATTRAPLTPMALLVLGASNEWFDNNRLPYDFGNMGAANCYLFVSIDLRFATSSKKRFQSPQASARMELPVPFAPGLVGSRLFSQWFFYQAGANALSMTVTNGASVRIAANPNLESTMVQSLSLQSPIGRVTPERTLALRLEDR